MNATAPRTSSTAVISMVFGILCWSALPLVGAVVAIVTGHVARSEIRRNPEAVEGDAMAVAGLVLGWVNMATVILGISMFLGMFGGIAWLAWLAG